ncbi:MAG: hypothetical protein ABI693_10385 [Bryobacteraceae bacterium]
MCLSRGCLRKLLFYTDGQTIWDSVGTVRASGLQGNTSSTQSAIIVPDPASSSRYYVFTADGVTGGNNHVAGVRVDVSTWPTPTPIASLFTSAVPPTAGLSPTEKLTAMQHANCIDYWVLTVVQPIPRGQQDVGDGLGSVRVLLVTASGVQFIGDTPTNVNIQPCW